MTERRRESVTDSGRDGVAAYEQQLAEAEEVVLTQFLTLLDGCDDDDLVRPQMVFEALREVWSPSYAEEFPEVTAGEMRGRIIAARGQLARGDHG